MNKIKSYQKLSLLAGVVLIVAVLLLVMFLQSVFERDRLAIKVNSVKLELQEMAADVNEAYEMDPEYNFYFVVNNAARWDLQDYRFSAAYQKNENGDYDLLTPRTNNGQANVFDPWIYPDLVERIESEASQGEQVVMYASVEEDPYPFYIYWMKVPGEMDNPYIVINGVSHKSIQTPVDKNWHTIILLFIVISIVFTLVRTVFEFFMVTEALSSCSVNVGKDINHE